MKLSEHFSLEEFTRSPTAERRGIDNTPSLGVMENLHIVAARMEDVRAALSDNPIYIDSGYRSAALNAVVGGAKKSAHCLGWAVDFVCPTAGTPKEIVQKILSSHVEFDQIIYEGTWVHISFAPAARRQILTAHFDSGGTTYSLGVE